jgi:malate permease and related proteins
LIDTQTITLAVVPVYLMILAGAAARWLGWVPRGTEAGLTALTVQLLLPCLILDRMLGSSAPRNPAVLAWSAGLGFATIAAGAGIAYLAGRAAGLQRGSGLRTFGLAAGLQNYGFTALPVLAAVFPGKDTMSVLFLHNLGVELAIWTVGVMLLQGSWGGLLRVFRNGPILAVLLGVLMVHSRWDERVPQVAATALAGLGGSAIPLSLLLVGLTMADLAFSERPNLRVAVLAIGVRLGLLAAGLLALAKFLPIPLELRQVLVIQAAMPAAVFPIILARHYGGHPATAIQVVVATSAAALFTIPPVVMWGARWVFGP